jgi:hypothetical protein
MEDENHSLITSQRMPWDKGKLSGAKPPLRPKHVWSMPSPSCAFAAASRGAQYLAPLANKAHATRASCWQAQRPPP